MCSLVNRYLVLWSINHQSVKPHRDRTWLFYKFPFDASESVPHHITMRRGRPSKGSSWLPFISSSSLLLFPPSPTISSHRSSQRRAISPERSGKSLLLAEWAREEECEKGVTNTFPKYYSLSPLPLISAQPISSPPPPPPPPPPALRR